MAKRAVLKDKNIIEEIRRDIAINVFMDVVFLFPFMLLTYIFLRFLGIEKKKVRTLSDFIDMLIYDNSYKYEIGSFILILILLVSIFLLGWWVHG